MKTSPSQMAGFSFAIILTALFVMALGQTIKPYERPFTQFCVGSIAFFILGMIIVTLTEQLMKAIRGPVPVQKTESDSETTNG
jgi:predicted acyltransferase